MRLHVQRQDPERDESPWLADYEVPTGDDTTVLDALMWVREHLDPSLACRFSCRSANACKECIALVDGTPRYLCTTRITSEHTIKPLPNRPLLRDLVVRFGPGRS